MKKQSLKKIGISAISLLLAISFAIPTSLAVMPAKKAEAQSASGAKCAGIFASIFATIFGEHVAGAVSSVPTNRRDAATADEQTGAQAQSQYITDCIEKPLALSFAKRMLDTMTSDMVDWINDPGGKHHKGPSFITDPKSFFLDTADAAVGDFLLGSDLAFLCSPFKEQIKLTLALKYQGSNSQRADCTLSEAIGNVQNAFEPGGGGGLAGFASMTQHSSNNAFGSYFQGESEMNARAGDSLGLVQTELNWNGGFLSYTTCTSAADGHPYTKYGPSANVNVIGQKGTINAPSPGDSCTTQTPGSVIASQLNGQLGVAAQQLGVADDLDKIFNAIANKMLSNVLGGSGLLGLTTSQNNGASRPNFFNEIKAQDDASTTEAKNQADQNLNNSNSAGNSGQDTSGGTQTAINVAVNKPVYVAPGSEYKFSAAPSYVTNGSKDDGGGNGNYVGWFSEERPTNTLWLKVDLQSTQEIGTIGIYQRYAATNPPIDFYAQVLDAGGNVVWQSAKLHEDFRDPFILTVPNGPNGKPIQGTAVRLQGDPQSTASGRLEIAEVEVYPPVPPAITLKGSPNMIIALNSSFSDPGAIGVDGTNNPVTVTVQSIVPGGSVNTSIERTYTITYIATDSRGLTATKIRHVTVQAGYTGQ